MEEVDKVKLHSFLRADALDKFMFAWVTCLLSNFPGTSIESALLNFAKYYEIEHINIDSLKVKYHRMKTDFYDYLKTNGSAT